MIDRTGWVWFHCTTHAYGAWLYGDPRGFRTRHHREHVEGDYKNRPPAGTHDHEFERSKKLLKQPPVIFSREWRPVVGAALRERLLLLGAEVICLSVGGQHVHCQMQTPVDMPREWMGTAKKHCWFVGRDCGWVGQMWAKRSRAEPIRDRGHQENAFHYIRKHVREGAWVWTFRDPPPESPPVATGGL